MVELVFVAVAEVGPLVPLPMFVEFVFALFVAVPPFVAGPAVAPEVVVPALVVPEVVGLAVVVPPAWVPPLLSAGSDVVSPVVELHANATASSDVPRADRRRCLGLRRRGRALRRAESGAAPIAPG